MSQSEGNLGEIITVLDFLQFLCKEWGKPANSPYCGGSIASHSERYRGVERMVPTQYAISVRRWPLNAHKLHSTLRGLQRSE